MYVYPVVDGKIRNSGVEINPVHHCNLRCKSCCHMSPVLPAVFCDPDVVVDDLTRLGEVYHADFLRVMGGEPLLHPDLSDLLIRIRRTGIADEVRICTNGLLLDQRGDEVWDLVDEMEISSYPGNCITNEQLDRYRARAKQHGVRLEVHLIGWFREAFATGGTDNHETINRIFKSCLMVQRWRCHTVQEGHVYRCPPSYFMHLMPGWSGDPTIDGMPIGSGAGFRDELKAFLESPRWPEACRSCLGTAGKKFPHQQVTRPQWQSTQDGTSEELLDWEYVEAVERDPVRGGDSFNYLRDDEHIPDEWYESQRGLSIIPL